jgi:hypothetical protein
MLQASKAQEAAAPEEEEEESELHARLEAVKS